MDQPRSRDISTSSADLRSSNSGHAASDMDRSMLQDYDGGSGQFQDQYSLLGQFPGYPSLPDSLSMPMWENSNVVPSSVPADGEHTQAFNDGNGIFQNANMSAIPQWNSQEASHLMNDFNAPASSSMSYAHNIDPAFQTIAPSQYQNIEFLSQNQSSEQPLLSAGPGAASSQSNSQSSTSIADGKVNPNSWSTSMAPQTPSGYQLQGLAPYMTNQSYQALSNAKASATENRSDQQSLPSTTTTTTNAPTTFYQLPGIPPPIASAGQSSFRVIDANALSKSISGFRPFNSLVAIGTVELEMPQVKASPVSLIPKLEERFSISQLQKLAIRDGESKTKLDRVEKKRDPNRTRSVSSATSSSRLSPNSDSSSESDSETEHDSSDDEAEEPPLPTTRPSDPIKAVEYDVIKAVWHSESKYLENETLFSQISKFSVLFLKLRDDWKKANESLKAAVEAKSPQMNSLKQNVTNQRNILEAAAKAAVEFGHHEILETLGQNPRLLASMQPILLDRAKEGDHNSSLSISILKLLVLFKGVTMEALELTKLSKILSSFSKKGNEEVKALVKSITDKASSTKEAKSPPPVSSSDTKPKSNVTKSSSELKAISVKTPASPKPGDVSKNASSAESKIKSDAKVADTSSGLKRSRPVEAASNATVKRVNTGVASTSGTKNASTTPSATVKKPIMTLGSKSSANASPPVPAITKAKASATAPKSTSSFFSSMQSATRKGPITEKPTSAVTAPSTASIASINPAFSFGMLDDLLKPKEQEAKSKSEATKSDETEEEKSKRLKKEARRKLRVSWKEEGDLVAVRYFDHDPEEDTGHDANLVRDVGDVGNEGRMFKQLHKDHFDLEAEEEEKEEAFGESEYRSPSEVDVSEDIDAQDVSKFYIRFAGGTKEPSSEDCKIQQDREANTLMEIYYSREDIPPRPKSPSEPYTNLEHPTLQFGTPDEKTTARSNALMQAAAPVVDPALTNVRDLLKALGAPTAPPNQVQQWSAPVPPPAIPSQPQPGTDVGSNLESIFAQFAAPQNQALQAPQTATPPAMFPPFSTQPAPTSDTPPNPLAALAGLFPPPPPYQNMPVPPPQASGPDLSSIIAALSQHNQPPAPQQQEYVPPAAGASFVPQSSAPPPDPSALLASLGPLFAAMPGLIPPPPTSTPDQARAFDSADRKRGRDDDDRDAHLSKRQNSGTSANGRGGFQGKKWQGSSTTTSSSAKPKFSIESKKFSQPCKFWPLGKCMKGTECTYRHDPL